MTYKQMKARYKIIKDKATPRFKYSALQYFRHRDEQIYTEKEIDLLNQIEKRGFIYGSKC